jgi:hypothetical protein
LSPYKCGRDVPFNGSKAAIAEVGNILRGGPGTGELLIALDENPEASS